jgi:hypothetical protein
LVSAHPGVPALAPQDHRFDRQGAEIGPHV